MNQLSPIIRNFVPGLPEIGKIKIGKKGTWKTSSKGNEYQPPQKLDHFLITKFDRDESGNFILNDELMDILKKDKKNVNEAGNLVRIPVILLYNDIAANFQSRFTCYQGRTLWCYGDGQDAYRIDKSNQYQPTECPCERCQPEYTGNQKCKPYGMLSVIIPAAQSIGGVWKFRTTSYFNCRNIPSSMIFIKALSGGQLSKIPLDMIIEPQMATLRDGTQQKIWLVKLMYTAGDMNQLAETGYQMALADTNQQKRMKLIEQEASRLIEAEIQAPSDDDTLDEFYPEEAENRGPEEAQDKEPEKEQEKETPKLPEPQTEPTESEETQTEPRDLFADDAPQDNDEPQEQEPQPEPPDDDAPKSDDGDFDINAWI